MEECEADKYDPTTPSLLAMADAFLGKSPPMVPESVRCLMAVLSQNPPSRIEARARLQLGLTLYHHTNNLLEAREHLDKAVLVAQSGANLEEVRFEATSISARILVEQQCFHQAKSLLRGRVDSSSTHYPYWHLRLLLQLADVSMSERDEGGVVSTLNRCAEYAKQVDAPYTRLLCNLYKGAFLLTHHRYQEAGEVLNHTSGLMEEYHGDKETLIRTFYLIVQVSHLLVAGQVKAAKPHLKQLQQRVKALSSDLQSQTQATTNSMDSRLLAENFQWLTREQTFVMVYLVSVMHSVQGGYTDKALTYAEKAMHFMPAEEKDSSVVSVLRAHLLEQIIQCLLMKGETAASAEKIQEVLGVCHSHSQLVYSHRAVLHSLLGLYAFSVDNYNRAAIQFHTALQHTNSGELRVFISLNLALTYMKQGDSRSTELSALMKSIESESATESCQSLRAALHYVRGLYAFIQLKLHEAKRHLRETLLMSNKSDLNRLTTCSLVLLGQIFLSIGNTKETLDMVNPAVQLASKIPDKKLQVWAATLLADLYHSTGDQDKEIALRQQSSAIASEIQSDQSRAVHSEHHNLIQWTVGEWPVTERQKFTHISQPAHHHHQRKARQKLDTSISPSTKISPVSQHNSMPPEAQSQKKMKREDLDPKRVNQGLSENDGDSSTGEQGAKVSLKDSRINLLHDSPSRNSSNHSSPTLNSSPVSIRTPELKLKKVTTPTSAKIVHSLSSLRDGNERIHNKEAHNHSTAAEPSPSQTLLTQERPTSSQLQSLKQSPYPPPPPPPSFPNSNQPAYHQSQVERIHYQQERVSTPNHQNSQSQHQYHHYHHPNHPLPPPHTQSTSASQSPAMPQLSGGGGAIGNHGSGRQKSGNLSPIPGGNSKVGSMVMQSGVSPPLIRDPLIVQQQGPTPQQQQNPSSQQHITHQQHIQSSRQHTQSHNPSPQQHNPSPQPHNSSQRIIPSPQQHNLSPQQHMPSPQENNPQAQLQSHNQALHLRSLHLQRTPLGGSSTGTQFLNNPHALLYQERAEGLQYQQKLMAHQKQIEEERLKQQQQQKQVEEERLKQKQIEEERLKQQQKQFEEERLKQIEEERLKQQQKLMQLEHQKLLEQQLQLKRSEGLPQYQGRHSGGVAGGAGGNSGQMQQNILHQQMLQRQQQQQQQQQQLLLHQAQMQQQQQQQQYLLQQGAAHSPSRLVQPSTPYNIQPTSSNYYTPMNQMPPGKSSPQMAHLMHMRSQQLLASQEQNRTIEQIPHQMMGMTHHHHYPPPGAALPNGANLAGPNPIGSPLRHFNPHH